MAELTAVAVEGPRRDAEDGMGAGGTVSERFRQPGADLLLTLGIDCSEVGYVGWLIRVLGHAHAVVVGPDS